MNTAKITGPAAAIYGVGPNRRDLTPRDASRADAVSAFVLAVRDVIRAPRVNPTGGTFGAFGAYIVGGYADSVVIRATAEPYDAVASAVEFATRHPVGDGAGLGFWTDEHGRVWLDAVQAFDDYENALDAARANGERAIYRASDGECIPVN